MLHGLSSPESYFQAAFRVQSPWAFEGAGGEAEIPKEDYHVFDFALNRVLKGISNYSRNPNVDESSPEKKVGKFVRFLRLVL